MKTIPLTRGLVALVDDDDFEALSRFNWHAIQRSRDDPDSMVARRRVKLDGYQRATGVYMHRALCPGYTYVRHIDGNTLNNQRANLRGNGNQ